ncbi:hypothetical protein ACOMHN_054222 [Nucella lapillus]
MSCPSFTPVCPALHSPPVCLALHSPPVCPALPFIHPLSILPFIHPLSVLYFIHPLSILPFIHPLSVLYFIHPLSILPFIHPLSVLYFIHPLSILPFIHPLSVLSFIHPLSILPFIHPLSVLSFIHPLSVLPFIQPLSVLPFIHPLSVLSFIHPLSVLPFIHPLSVLPFIHPLSVLPFIHPLSVLSCPLFTSFLSCPALHPPPFCLVLSFIHPLSSLPFIHPLSVLSFIHPLSSLPFIHPLSVLSCPSSTPFLSCPLLYSPPFCLPADMAVGAIAKTQSRESVMDFTEWFHASSVQLLLVRPSPEDGPGAGLLLAPFCVSAWVLVVLAFLLVTAGFFLIGRFSPHEWIRVSPEKDVRRARYSFGLRNSFLFTVSTLTWQGYREAPKSLSGRVLAVSWWMFVSMILIAYTSNLTALLSSRPHARPALTFRNYEDILRDRSLDIGMIQSEVSQERQLTIVAVPFVVQIQSEVSQERQLTIVAVPFVVQIQCEVSQERQLTIVAVPFVVQIQSEVSQERQLTIVAVPFVVQIQCEVSQERQLTIVAVPFVVQIQSEVSQERQLTIVAVLFVGQIQNGDADLELQSSEVNLERQLHEYVSKNHNWVANLTSGLKRMRHSGGKFALLLPSYKARYLAAHHCDLITFGHALGMIHYAFGFPAGSSLKALR